MKKIFTTTLAIALIATGLTFTSCGNNGNGLTNGKYTTKYVDEHLPGGYWVHEEIDNKSGELTAWYIIQFIGQEKLYSATIYAKYGEDLTLENFNSKKEGGTYNGKGYVFDEKTQILNTISIYGKLIKLTATELIIEDEDWGTMKFTKYQTLP